jgi:hypothetical protein
MWVFNSPFAALLLGSVVFLIPCDVLSYQTETNPDHERMLEIVVRANSGETELSKPGLLLSTLTLHWGAENAREVINDFAEELNGRLTRKNRLNKDFVMNP